MYFFSSAIVIDFNSFQSFSFFISELQHSVTSFASSLEKADSLLSLGQTIVVFLQNESSASNK
ncbi:hypothetical protein Plano_2663 [Planococcus sp. PAMC 21323]|nr:hypothetical protein Plano_2663 [Planococcus sp. PAMC 21323]